MAKRKRADTVSVRKHVGTRQSVSPGAEAESDHIDQHETRDVTAKLFSVPYADKTVECSRRGSSDPAALIFTHGAGGGMDSPVMTEFAVGFASIAPIVCFQGNMNLKSRIKSFSAVFEHERKPVAIGGRSMGARAAVLTALEHQLEGSMLVLPSYPLTAGKNGDKREPERREQILLDLPQSTCVLFIIGSKDAQCNLELLSTLRQDMKARSWLIEVTDANHGMELSPKRASPDMRETTGRLAAEWMSSRDLSKRYCRVYYDTDTGQVVSQGWSKI